MTKKIVSLFLTLTMLVTACALCIPAAADAPHGECGPYVTWCLEGDTLTLDGYGPMNQYHYMEFGDAPWYDLRDQIKKVVIGREIISIGYTAFDGCSAIAEVLFLGSKAEWGLVAVYGGNDYLLEAPLSFGIVNEEEYWDWAFEDGVVYITGVGPMDSFRGHENERPWASMLSKITKVVICDGITQIGAAAFTNCQNLVEVVAGRDVSSIGMDAFSYSGKLNAITFNGPISAIGQGVVFSCSSLKYVTITGQSKSQFLSAANRFYYNDAFGSATFTTKSVGDPVTYDTEITGTCGEGLTWSLKDGVLTVSGIGAMDDFEDAPWYAYADKIKTVVIEEGVSSVGVNAFSDCTNLKNLTLHDSVTAIGEWAFSWCESLKSIELPENLRQIGAYTFYGCAELSEISIPGDVVAIGAEACAECGKLSDIYYGASKEAWQAVAVDGGNAPLENAIVHCTDGDILPPVPRLLLTSAAGQPGDTVEVEVRIENNPGIWAMDLLVVYDKASLTLTNVQNGGFFKDSEWTHNPLTAEKYVLSFESNDFFNKTAGEGLLAILTFTVNKDAAEGDHEVTVYTDNDRYLVINTDMDELDFDVLPGSVTAEAQESLYGDVNADGKINKKDSLDLKKYLADSDYAIDLAAADVNCDGKVNKKDALRLKQYLANWDVQLGA